MPCLTRSTAASSVAAVAQLQLPSATFSIHQAIVPTFNLAHAAFVETQRQLGARLEPGYGDGLCLDDEDLQKAVHVYEQWLAEADKRMQRALGLGPDPLVHCFICQDSLRDQLNDGEPLFFYGEVAPPFTPAFWFFYLHSCRCSAVHSSLRFNLVVGPANQSGASKAGHVADEPAESAGHRPWIQAFITTPVPGLPSLCLAGTPLPDYNIAITADATVKAAHFSSAGRSQRDIQPLSDMFLGQVARLVLEKFRTGELTSAAQQQYDCATAEGEDGADSCSSNLTCSRASASARGVVDFCGISGVTCAHSFPLLGCYVAMPAPEQFPYHIAAIAEALTRRPDIRHVYIDIACRILAALLAELQKLVQSTPSRLPQSTVEKVSTGARQMGCPVRG
jgi:hypothetical protein